MQDLEEWLTRPGGVAARMRELRQRAGLSAAELSRAIGWTPSKTSKIEAGKQLASPKDLDAWFSQVGASDSERTELRQLREDAEVRHLHVRYRLTLGMPAIQADYARLVSSANVVRTVTPTVVPGLLQVPGYVRALISGLRETGFSGLEDVDAGVSARLKRQHALYDLDKRFDFLIGEAALRWLPANREVMTAQLDRLHAATLLPNVRLAVLPFGFVRTPPADAFSVYINGDGDTIAAIEYSVEDTYYRGDQAEVYQRLADTLWSEAVEGDGARRLILAAIKALPED